MILHNRSFQAYLHVKRPSLDGIYVHYLTDISAADIDRMAELMRRCALNYAAFMVHANNPEMVAGAYKQATYYGKALASGDTLEYCAAVHYITAKPDLFLTDMFIQLGIGRRQLPECAETCRLKALAMIEECIKKDRYEHAESVTYYDWLALCSEVVTDKE